MLIRISEYQKDQLVRSVVQHAGKFALDAILGRQGNTLIGKRENRIVLVSAPASSGDVAALVGAPKELPQVEPWAIA